MSTRGKKFEKIYIFCLKACITYSEKYIFILNKLKILSNIGFFLLLRPFTVLYNQSVYIYKRKPINTVDSIGIVLLKETCITPKNTPMLVTDFVSKIAPYRLSSRFCSMSLKKKKLNSCFIVCQHVTLLPATGTRRLCLSHLRFLVVGLNSFSNILFPLSATSKFIHLNYKFVENKISKTKRVP